MRHSYSTLLPRWATRPLAALGLLLATAGAAQAQTPAFGPMTTYAVGGTQDYYVATGDLNGDGVLDLVSSNNYSSNVSVLLGQAAGGFAAAVTYATGSTAEEIVLADINGDAKLDVVLTSSSGVNVLLGTGTGTLGTSRTYPTGAGNGFNVQLYDVTRDGIPDAVTANIGSLASVLPGTAAGTFGPATNYTAGSSERGLRVADFNRDGFADLAISDVGQTNVYVLLGQASGFATPVSYPTGQTSYFLELADLNRDGQLDIIVSGLGTTSIKVLAGNANGTFTAAVAYQAATTGTFLTGLAVGDVNGDGYPDVLVADGSQNRVYALPGSSTGALGTAVAFSVGAFVYDITLADINRDGRPDLVVANAADSNIGVLLNTTVFAPTLTTISPNPAAAGTSVTLTGSNLTGATAVTFTGTSNNTVTTGLTVSSTGSSQTITVTVPTGANTGPVTVTTPGGTSNGVAFTVVTAAPVVTAPVNGSTTNGQLTFAGTAPAGSIVTVYLAAGSGATQAIGTTTATGGSFSLAPATALTSGSYSVYATAQSSGQAVSANSNTNTFTVDATAPTLLSFVRQTPTAALTNASAVTYRLTFSEAVTNVRSALNVAATGSVGSTGLALTAVSPSTYDVTLSGISGNGTLTLSLAAQSGLADLAGNAYAGGAVAGPTYTIDQAAPTAVLTTTASSTSTAPIPFTLSFSEPVTGLSASSLSVSNGTVTAGSLSGSGSGPYTFRVTPTGNGPVTVSVAANAVQDAAGNGNPASNAVSVQYTAPVASGLSVLYQTGDFGQPTDNQLRPFLQLVNSGTTAVPYSSLTVRYWLTAENFQGQLVTPIDYAKLGTSFVSARYVQLATPRQGAFGYIEYSFAAGAGNLAVGTDSGPIYGKAYKPDYTNFDETDDWSYQTSSSFTTNAHVTLYQNGTLVNGTEPPAVTATTALQVYAASRDASASTQYVGVQLQVRNTGNVPVNYSDLKVRYYLTRDGASTLVANIDYAKLGASNIGVRVVNLAAPVTGADAYVEFTFSSALGVFYPRTSTDDILAKIRRDDYGPLDQTNDYSFSGSTTLAVNNRFPAYLNGSLIFGTPPTGAPARLAATTAPASASAGGATIVAAASGPLELALTASPNPFSDQLRLTFALPTAQAYTLAVYDGQGRLVKQLARGQAAAGEAQELAVPTQGYATGLYLVRLTTAAGVQTLKLIKQ